MFKNFNWKRYAIRVVISWAIFAFVIGAISGFAQEESIWHSIGETEDNAAIIYVLRNAVVVNQDTNLVIITKVEITDIGVVYCKWELDCKNKLARITYVGESLETFIEVKDKQWITPTKDSAIDKLLKPICSVRS